MYVSVSDERLASAGHSTVAEGLSRLGIGRLQLSISEAGEAPRLDVQTPAYIYVGHESGARAYRAHLYELGIRASSVHLSWAPIGELGDEALQWAAGVARGAGVLGAEVAVFDAFPEATEETGSDPQALAAASRALLAGTAGSNTAVALACRPWSWARGRVLRDVLRDVEDDRLGVSLDPAGLRQSGLPLGCAYDAVRELAPHTCHVVCSGLRVRGPERDAEVTSSAGCSLAEGDIDYAWVAAALGRTGYRGDLCLGPDFASDGACADRRLTDDAAYLKDIIGAY